MNKLLSGWIVLSFSACVYSQVNPMDGPRPLSPDAQRSRIQTQRAQQDTSDRQKEAACYRRFAVTDCLRQVRVQRRAVLDDLRRQELVLNDAQRKQRAMDQLDRIEEQRSNERQAAP